MREPGSLAATGVAGRSVFVLVAVAVTGKMYFGVEGARRIGLGVPPDAGE